MILLNSDLRPSFLYITHTHTHTHTRPRKHPGVFLPRAKTRPARAARPPHGAQHRDAPVALTAADARAPAARRRGRLLPHCRAGGPRGRVAALGANRALTPLAAAAALDRAEAAPPAAPLAARAKAHVAAQRWRRRGRRRQRRRRRRRRWWRPPDAHGWAVAVDVLARVGDSSHRARLLA